MRAKILLLEDDIALAETLMEYLEAYDVLHVSDGEKAQDALYEHRFDLLILDVNVPKLDGFDLLQSARKEGVDTPAIFMTTRSNMDDLETGYASGADDYLRKPFALRELGLRIESLLKRAYNAVSSRIEIDARSYFLIDSGELFIDGRAVSLSPKETRLLKLFLRHEGEVLSHERIAEYLWDYDENVSDSALRTYIKNLRKLLGKERIVSHKKLGYQFR